MSEISVNLHKNSQYLEESIKARDARDELLQNNSFASTSPKKNKSNVLTKTQIFYKSCLSEEEEEVSRPPPSVVYTKKSLD